MTVPLPADEGGRIGAAKAQILAATERATSVALGPGLGRSPTLDTLVRELYAELPVPLVVDADGLNALAAEPLPSPAAPRILTPHPGEFRRLCPDVPSSRPDRDERAKGWAAEQQVVLVLKGHNTLITDGTRWAHNLTGNPGMATGGTGDVLTGIITALLAQGLSPFEAAHLGCHIHGLAGDLAAARVGEVALVASDLVQSLASAWIAVGSGR
jgi:NAD(P)H-hydrate epimerase